jgi:hypothetical protein
MDLIRDKFEIAPSEFPESTVSNQQPILQMFLSRYRQKPEQATGGVIEPKIITPFRRDFLPPSGFSARLRRQCLQGAEQGDVQVLHV